MSAAYTSISRFYHLFPFRSSMFQHLTILNETGEVTPTDVTRGYPPFPSSLGLAVIPPLEYRNWSVVKYGFWGKGRGRGFTYLGYLYASALL